MQPWASNKKDEHAYNLNSVAFSHQQVHASLVKYEMHWMQHNVLKLCIQEQTSKDETVDLKELTNSCTSQGPINLLSCQ